MNCRQILSVFLEIGKRLGDKLHVFDHAKFDVALMAKKAAKALVARFTFSATGVVVVDGEPSPSLMLGACSAYRALSGLKRQFSVVPRTIHAELVEPLSGEFLLYPLRTHSILPLLVGFNSAILAVLSGCLYDFIFVPFIIFLCGTESCWRGFSNRLFGRGHARVTSRVGFARCDQHLTPSLYLLSGGVRG